MSPQVVEMLRKERGVLAAQLAAMDALLAMQEPPPDALLSKAAVDELLEGLPAEFCAVDEDGGTQAAPAPHAETKLCLWCGKEKPRIDFVIRASSRDGMAGHCLACHNARYSPRRVRRPEVENAPPPVKLACRECDAEVPVEDAIDHLSGRHGKTIKPGQVRRYFEEAV